MYVRECAAIPAASLFRKVDGTIIHHKRTQCGTESHTFIKTAPERDLDEVCVCVCVCVERDRGEGRGSCVCASECDAPVRLRMADQVAITAARITCA